MSRRITVRPLWILGLALVAWPANCPAQTANSKSAASDGISVYGAAEVMARPNVVEIDLHVAGKAELTGDALVKYRDAKGRTATASDSIVLNIPVTPSPSPTRTLTRTPRPTVSATATAAPSPTDTPTELPTETPTSTPTITALPTMVTETPTATPSPIATITIDVMLTLGSSAVISALGFAVVIVILLAVLKDTGIQN